MEIFPANERAVLDSSFHTWSTLNVDSIKYSVAYDSFKIK